MALSQKHRNALFVSFLPQLGDEVTEAFLAEFPAREGDELVTRSHQRAEFAEMRREMVEFQAAMRAEMAAFQAAMRAEMAAMRAEMAESRAETRVQVADLRTEVHEQAAAINRRLTTVVLTATGLLIAAGGAMTTIVIASVG